MAAFGTGINAALGRIDYTPYLQGASQGSAAIGRGIESLGQGVAGAIKEYSQNKEMRDLLTQNNETQAQKALRMSDLFKSNPTIFNNQQPFSEKTLQDLKNMPNMSMGRLKALNAELNAAITKYEPVVQQFIQTENTKQGVNAAMRLINNGQDPFSAFINSGLSPELSQNLATGIMKNRQIASEIESNQARMQPAKDVTFSSQSDLEKKYPPDKYDYNFVPNEDGTVTVVGGKISPRAMPVVPGSQYRIDQVTGKTVPIEGTEAYFQHQQKTEKWFAGLNNQKNKIQNILDVIQRAKNQSNLWTSGLLGKSLSSLSGTEAADLRANLDTIEANLGFDQLQELRSNSPTGGALGNVSGTELNALQSSWRNLKQSQSPQQLAENLDSVFKNYTRTLDAIEKEASNAIGLKSTGVNTGTNRGKTDEELLNQYGPTR
jgi:hypothetical protein